MALLLEPLVAAKAKESQIRKPESVPQISAEQKSRSRFSQDEIDANEKLGRAIKDREKETRAQIASFAGVSHDTIAKAKVIARQLTVSRTQ